WRAFDRAGNAHESAQRLHCEVIARALSQGPCPAKAGNGTDDKPGIDRQQVFRGQAKLNGARSFEVLDQHVAALDQLPEQVRSFWFGKIERDRPLVAIAREEVGAQFTEERRPPFTGLVSLARPLDLDHLRAEVAQHLATKWPGKDAGR